jgi:hypothetical protein
MKIQLKEIRNKADIHLCLPTKPLVNIHMFHIKHEKSPIDTNPQDSIISHNKPQNPRIMHQISHISHRERYAVNLIIT